MRTRSKSRSLLKVHKRNGKIGISNPVFNYREIAKQMLLLEDHLTQDEKYCKDCIRKHLMTIEALAEEANLLDKNNIHRSEAGLPTQSRKWMSDFTDGYSKFKLSQAVRKARKRLVNKYYDPRLI